MNIVIVLLRLIHIFAGVFWAGSIFAFTGFVQPAVKASAPESNKFMQRLMTSGFVTAMSTTGPLTILSGLILFWIDSAGLRVEWLSSAPGLGFTAGAIAGLIAFVIGMFVSRPTTANIAALGREMQTAGGPPTSEQLSRMQILQARTAQASLWTVIFLVVAVSAMATARYLG